MYYDLSFISWLGWLVDCSSYVVWETNGGKSQERDVEMMMMKIYILIKSTAQLFVCDIYFQKQKSLNLHEE